MILLGSRVRPFRLGTEKLPYCCDSGDPNDHDPGLSRLRGTAAATASSSVGLRGSLGCRAADPLLGLATLSGLDASDRLKVLKMPLISRTLVLLVSWLMFCRSMMNSRICLTTDGGFSLGSHHSDMSMPHTASSLMRKDVG